MRAIFSARTRHPPKLVVTSMWIGVLGCALLTVTTCVQAQQQVGYVVDFEGRWFLNDGSPITKKGQSLPGGGTVSRRSASEYDSIAIADLSGQIIVARKTCQTRSECDTPIKLPPPPRQRGPLATVFGTVMSLVWGEPDRYSVHRSRDGELNDGVVQVIGEQIDLSSMFALSETGKYYFRLVPVGKADKQLGYQSVGPITLDWDPKHTSPVPVPGLHFGLYELILLERVNGAYDPTDVTAWVLISRPQAYRVSKASYQQALGLTKEWGNDVTPEAARGFLRAHLDQLARDEAK